MSREGSLPQIDATARAVLVLSSDIEGLGRLKLADIAQIKTSSSDNIPDELVAARDGVFDEDKQWDKDSIIGAFTQFRHHESLAAIEHSLEESSYLTRYFVRNIGEEGLKLALFNCFNVLCQASVLGKEERGEFSSTFPPPESDLLCLPGTATRFNDILEKMQVQEGFDRVALDSVHSALSQMVELIKPHIETSYHVHILSCVKYVVGLESEEEIKKLDPHAMPVLYDIPTSVMMDVLN